MTDYTARNVLLKDSSGNYLIPYTEKADLSLGNLNSAGKAYVAIKGYDSTATYSLNEVVMTVVSGSVLFYRSLVNNNTSSLSDTTKWSEVSFGSGANTDLSNLSSTGEAHFANPSLSNLSAAGEAHFANPSLSNLSAAGEAHFANPSLSNLSAAGEAHFANPSLSNLTNGLANTICTTSAGTSSTATNKIPAVIVKNYRNGKSWYRIWSDGWIEQGGEVDCTNGIATVNLLVAHNNSDYSSSLTLICEHPTIFYSGVIYGKNTTGFTVYQNVGYTYSIKGQWRTEGY